MCIVWKQLEVFFHLDLTPSDTQAVGAWGWFEVQVLLLTIETVKVLKLIKKNMLGAPKGRC